jgi:hypothetical protein
MSVIGPLHVVQSRRPHHFRWKSIGALPIWHELPIWQLIALPYFHGVIDKNSQAIDFNKLIKKYISGMKPAIEQA